MPDWPYLIEVADAAPLLGMNPGALRRKCASELMGKALAFQAPPPGGGNVRWWIDRRYDPALVEAPVGEQMPDGVAQLTAKQRRDMGIRLICIEALNRERSTRSVPQKDWIGPLCAQLSQQHGLKVSPRSLLRWEKQKKDKGMGALVDTRGGDNRSGGDPACWDYFKQLYLDENKRHAATCWRMVRDHARAEQLQWPSLAVVRRRMWEHFDRETALKNREPRKWRNSASPYIEQHPERFSANECWVSDHSQLDMWCWFGNELVRPWITTWQDWRTRKIMGYAVSTGPDGSTILAALRRAIIDNPDAGLPRVAWIDNGKDYAGYIFHGQTKQERQKTVVPKGYIDETSFQGIYAMLGIEVHFSLPYNPTGKPRQESFYRPLHERFCKSWASYSGNTPENRPERLAKILKTPGMVPAYDEVVEAMALQIEGYNRSNEHTIEDLRDEERRLLSPAQALANWTTHFRGLADPSVLDLLLQRWHRPVTVGRGGVSIRVRGMTIRYGMNDHRLRKFKAGGEKVLVTYDPADVRSVNVYTQQMKLVGTIASNRLGGVPGPVAESNVKELMREKREYEKAMKVVNKRGPARRVATPEQTLALEAYRKPQAQPDLLKGIQTPLDTPPKDPFKPDFKQAAGAEVAAPDPADASGVVSGGNVVSHLQQTRAKSAAKGTAGRITSGGRVAMPNLKRPKRGAEE